jgi:hypothetical protein
MDVTFHAYKFGREIRQLKELSEEEELAFLQSSLKNIKDKIIEEIEKATDGDNAVFNVKYMLNVSRMAVNEIRLKYFDVNHPYKNAVARMVHEYAYDIVTKVVTDPTIVVLCRIHDNDRRDIVWEVTLTIVNAGSSVNDEYRRVRIADVPTRTLRTYERALFNIPDWFLVVFEKILRIGA